MEGKEPDACCVPLSQVMQKEIYDSVYYILTKKTHLNTVFHWNLLAYNYLRVIPIYGGRVKGGKYWTVVYPCSILFYNWVYVNQRKMFYSLRSFSIQKWL